MRRRSPWKMWVGNNIVVLKVRVLIEILTSVGNGTELS